MKFSEMTYTRPDPAASKQRLSALTAELKAAKSYEEARKVFLSQQELMSHISTSMRTMGRAPVRSWMRSRASATRSTRETNSTTARKNSGTTSTLSWRNTIRRGQRRCSKARSARTLRRNTAI